MDSLGLLAKSSGGDVLESLSFQNKTAVHLYYVL